MINVLHLLWIVPASVLIGFLVAASMLTTEDEDEYEDMDEDMDEDAD
jgi:hypothetical protein